MRALLILVAACGGSSELQITSSEPAFGPVVGGTSITLTGTGFSSRIATPDRVLVGGKEAVLVAAIDDTTIDVVIPPGDQPGDAEIIVLHDDRNARATGIFHYSTPPTITSVEPADVLFSSTTTLVTVTGSGFFEEGAGDVEVAVDGTLATDVQVTSDTSLTFSAPPGIALVHPDLGLADRRGQATASRVFRYVPSTRPGLLLFPQFGAFAIFLDPLDLSFVTIPGNGSVRFTTITRDDFGDYWGVDRARRFGRIDPKTQAIEAPIQAQGTFPTMVRIGGEYFAIDRNSLRFGKLDPITGGFTAIGAAAIPCCGSYGLAFDGTTLYFTARQGAGVTITSIDPATGATGTPVPLIGAATLHIEEMRFEGGTLYATSRDGTLLTIDPTTGITTVLPVSLGRFNAMELYD